MSARFWITFLFAGLLASPLLRGADTRPDLLFQLSSALHGHDRVALAKCFNFQGTDEATRLSVLSTLEQIISWPTHYVTTSERSETGPLHVEKDGKKYTLNGDWNFQVHIFMKPPPSKGFVFPAGTANGKYMILLTTEERR